MELILYLLIGFKSKRVLRMRSFNSKRILFDFNQHRLQTKNNHNTIFYRSNMEPEDERKCAENSKRSNNLRTRKLISNCRRPQLVHSHRRSK